MAKKPKMFQYVEHYVPVGPGYTHRGIVDAFYSAQFGFTTADGEHRLCLFNEDWKRMGKRAERQHTTVEAPSVWRDHQSRTCIVLEVKDLDVTYIPMNVDEPFHLVTTSVDAFCGKEYLEPIDYPVSQAARLFVEYARNTGATDEVLEALTPHTTITEEEKEMARKKAAVEKKEPKPKKSATTSKAKREAGPKKPSAAQVYRDQIMAGKSMNQIFAAVRKQCPDAKEPSEAYLRYYVNELTKKGENPPWPKGLPEPRGKGRKAGE